MSFKLNGAPYNKDNMNIAVYRKDLKDGSAGKSNHTGIIVDTNVDKKTEEAVIAHETVHQHQQRNGELDYDEENFYWKGKTYPRENLNEHNENLPWEKEAYAKSNGILNGKQEDMKERFQLKGYRGNNKPFKTMSDRGLIGAQNDGAAAEMCGIGGGDDPTKCKGNTKAYDKVQGKKIKTRRTKKPKTTKHRGTLEKKSYVQKETTPGTDVGVSQITSGFAGGKKTVNNTNTTKKYLKDSEGKKILIDTKVTKEPKTVDIKAVKGKDTGWRNSEDYKNVKDFKNAVNKTNIIDSDLADKAAKYIKPSVTKQTLRQDELTRRNKKGKAKYSAKRTGYGEKGERATMRNPDALVTRKDRAIGKDKVRSYTTNEAHGSKQNKLVSKKKMNKLSAKATKKLTKGNPTKVKAPKMKIEKSRKDTSAYL